LHLISCVFGYSLYLLWGDGSGFKQQGSGRYAPYTLLLAQYSLLILQNYDTNRKSRGKSNPEAFFYWYQIGVLTTA